MWYSIYKYVWGYDQALKWRHGQIRFRKKVPAKAPKSVTVIIFKYCDTQIVPDFTFSVKKELSLLPGF